MQEKQDNRRSGAGRAVAILIALGLVAFFGYRVYQYLNRPEPEVPVESVNVMVERALFMKVRFNESVTTYGWEDVLLGVGLKEQGAEMTTIDNPLLHDDADKSVRFMEKTRESLNTLHTHEHLLLQYTRLGNVVNIIRRWHMAAVVRGLFVAARPLMEHQLLGRHPDMRVFAAYKLGYYLSLR